MRSASWERASERLSKGAGRPQVDRAERRRYRWKCRVGSDRVESCEGGTIMWSRYRCRVWRSAWGFAASVIGAAAATNMSIARAQDKPPPETQEMIEKQKREDLGPKVGDVAPNFKLKTLDEKREIELARFKGSKPVVLVFGSYT